MRLKNSFILNSINNGLSFVQDKAQPFVDNSFILKNIDNFILVAMALVFVTSLFLPSDLIGIVACIVIGLTILKLFLIKGQNLELADCNLWILVFIGISVLSVVNSALFAKSAYGFTKTLIYMGFYFSVIQYFRFNKNKIVPVFYLIGALVAIESVIGLLQNSLGLENISTWQDTSYVNPEDVLSRVYGTLQPYNPNLLAGYMIVGFPALMSFSILSLESKKYKAAIFGGILVLLSALTLFLTGCRGSYIALLAIVVGGLFASWQIVFKENMYGETLKKYWKYAVSSFAGLACLTVVCVPAILKRILSIFVMRQDSSTSFRMNVYHSSMQMFQDNLLLGIGTGNKTFREIYGLYMISGFDALSCYSVFLEIAVESGIFALIAYLIFLWTLLSNAYKAFVCSPELKYKTVIFTTAISVVSVMVHGFVDTIYFRPQVQFVFWTMVAILVVLLTENEKVED